MPTPPTTPRPSSKLWLFGALGLALAALLWLGLRERGGAPTRAEVEDEAGAATASPSLGPGAGEAGSRATTGAAGRVSTREGEAIAGALVTLVPLDGLDGLDGGDGGEQRPTTVRTDEGGGWSIAAITPGRYALSATAPGFLAGLRPELVLLRGSDNAGLDVRLEPGGNRLSGVVRDATGGVIEGALVQVTPQAGILRLRERDSYFSLTDEHGRYALQVPDGRHRIRASHPDYSSEQVVLELAGAAQQHDFALVPSAVIEGVVRRESDGVPVANAEVAWSRERSVILPGGERVSARERGGKLIADAQGRFRVRGLPPGLVALSARAPQLASGAVVEVPVGIAERVEGVELWLSPASDLRGRVIAAADGVGIAGARVELLGELGPGPTATSDAEGEFVIHGVLPGGYGLLASAEGFTAGPAPDRVEVAAGQDPKVELVLERGLTIRGRVEPPGRAEVAIELRPENLRMGGAGLMLLSAAGTSTSAAETGEFELGPVEPGRYTLDARTADGRGGAVEVEVGADGAEGVIIPLEQRASLTGRVEDWNGEPVGDVSVRARKRSPDASSLSVVVNGRELTAASAPTSTEGSFELAGLAAGTWIVEVVDAQGERLASEAPIELALVEGRREELLIRVEPRDGTITGTVRDAEGQPVADAWVSAAFIPPARAPEPELEPDGDEDGGVETRAEMRMLVAGDDGGPAPARPPVLTDAGGRFRFEGLRRGEYLLNAELDGGTSKATREGVRPDADVTLKLAPLGALEGRVLSNGEPADCVARIRGPSERRVRVRDGRFELERLEPGRYTLEASAGDGSTTGTVTIEAGATAEIELALERFATITGTVVDGAGQPVAGAEILIGSGTGGRVEISREDGDPQYFSDDDGSFEAHAAAGARVLIVQAPDKPMPLAIEPFVVEAGQALDLGEIREQQLDGMVRAGPEDDPEPG